MRARRHVTAIGVVLAAVASTLVCAVATTEVQAAPAPPSSFDSGLVVRDVVYDRQRDLVYASVDATDTAYPDQVVTIDPHTRQVVRTVSLGTIPSEMDISSDGSALFVGLDGRGAVAKVSLPSFVVQWTHVLGPYQIWNTTVVGDIAAMPGSSDVVAVSRRIIGISPEHAGIAIVDAAGLRRDLTAGHTGSDSIVFDAAGSRVFGSDLGSSGQYFFVHRVNADGIVTERTDSSWGGGSLARRGNLVFQSNGKVLDVSGAAPVLADTVTGGRGVGVDEAANRVYIGSSGYIGSELRAYDLDTRALVGQWTVPIQTGSASELTVLGTGSIAMVDRPHPASRTGRLLFIDLVNGPPTSTTTPPTSTTTPPTTAPPATLPPVAPPTNPPGNPVLPPTAPSGDLGSYGEYTPLTPQRIVDTRSGLGRDGLVAPLGPGQQVDLQVAGVGGVPSSGVAAVVANVTAVSPSGSGYLSVWPAGSTRPTISSLNFAAGDTVANLVTVRVGANGRISVFNPSGNVDVLVDVAGFYADVNGPDGLRFRAKTPTRILDTRDPERFSRAGILHAGETRNLSTFYLTGVPSDAQAVVLNVTVTDTTAPSFLSVYPADVGRPVVSNLNYVAGATRANQVIVRVPDAREISIYNHQGNAHVIVDVVGWFDNGEVGDFGRFIAVDPYRSLDTRLDSPWPAPGHLPAGATLRLIDDSVVVSAFAMNVTVTDTTGAGYVTAYPVGATGTPPAPLASTLNYTAGATVPNHAIVPAAPYVAFFNAGARAQLIVDVFGVFI